MVHGERPTSGRRNIVKAICGGSAAALAGCMGGDGGANNQNNGGNQSAQQANGGDAQKVNFWTTQVETDRQKVIKELIKGFESNHEPNISMTAVKENELPKRIPTARASGTLPAIAEFGLSPMQKLGSEGLLSKQAASDVIQSVGKDKFYKGALQLTQAPKGGHYAVPMHGWVQGMWYRKPVFEKHGLPKPTTWGNLLKAARTLHKPDQNQFGIVVGTKKTAFARQCFTPIARSNGARVFNKKGEIVFDSKEMIEALDYYAKLAQYTPPGADTWKTANHTYLNKQSHLIEYSTYIMGDLAGKKTEMTKNTGFAPYVEKKRRSTFGQVIELNFFNAASKAELAAAKKFAKFLMSDKQYVKWLHMAPGGMNPVLKPVARSKAFKNNETLNAWGSTVENVSQGFKNIERFGYIEGKAFPELGKITNKFLIASAVAQVVEGKDPKKVARQTARKMRETLKQ